MPLRLQLLGRRVPGWPGVDQGRLPLRRANQDRIALADVEKIDGDRPRCRRRTSSTGAGRARCRPARRGRARAEQRSRKHPKRLHSLMSPPGSVAFRSFWTLPRFRGELLGRLGVTLEAQVRTSPALRRGRKQRLGDVDRLAVLGHEDGDRLVLAFEPVEGKEGGHAVALLALLDNYRPLRDLCRIPPIGSPPSV